MTTDCLGGNVYLWSRTAQDRFLVACLGPAFRELRDRGLAQSFWFDRFDARGPHVFFLTRPVENLAAVRKHLARRLKSYLASGTSPGQIALTEIEERHRQVLGKTVCEADELPGIAEEGSFVLFEHDPCGYPFHLAAHLKDPPEFWRLRDDLSFWSIQQLEADPETTRSTGIRWAAALDRAMREVRVAREFWQFHAETLLPGLTAGQSEREKQRIFAYLERAVVAKNRDAFTRLWQEAESSPPPWPQIRQLVQIALAMDGSGERYTALRDAAHGTWKQLGIPVHQEVPMVLFAWGRS